MAHKALKAFMINAYIKVLDCKIYKNKNLIVFLKSLSFGNLKNSEFHLTFNRQITLQGKS